MVRFSNVHSKEKEVGYYSDQERSLLVVVF